MNQNVNELPKDIPRISDIERATQMRQNATPIPVQNAGINIGDLEKIFQTGERALLLFERFIDAYNSAKPRQPQNDPLNPTNNPMIISEIVRNDTPEQTESEGEMPKESKVSKEKVEELYDELIPLLQQFQDKKIGEVLPMIQASKETLIESAIEKLNE